MLARTRVGAAVGIAGMTILFAASCAGQDKAVPRSAPIRIGAYWWDGWVEGSPYLREPLLTQYKDREPVWGWRDDNQEAVDTSIKLAAGYGVDFFTFLWYPEIPWPEIPGKTLDVLNNGLRRYLSSTIPERTKVGFSLMIAIPPAPEAWDATCRAWARECLKLERYVRIDGRPIISFYTLDDIEKRFPGADGVRRALERLRAIAREEKSPDPFVLLRANGDEYKRMKEMGFDGATDYAIAWNAKPGEHPYDDLIALGEKTWDKYAGRGLSYVPSVTSGWDGRPREWMKVDYYAYWYRRSPAEFGRFVRRGLSWIRAHPGDTPRTPLLMIYAWHELDEGGWICPTKSEGAAYLEALRAARQGN